MLTAMTGAFLLLCAALACEKLWNERCLRSFKAVIHVNGIRGKSSTCRLLDAALRERYRVFTKTTGTDARVIDVHGRDEKLRRLGPASISEQLRIIRRAHRERAEVLILECMAVKPELQAICQRQIVKSGISIITNVRHDHVLEMGGELSDIAAALANTIPEHGTLFTQDERFFPFFQSECEKHHSRAVLCPPDAPGNHNRSIARAVARSLGMTDGEIERGFSHTLADFGASKLYATHNAHGQPIHFLNLFSCNDPESAAQQLLAHQGGGKPPIFLYNHRWDRPDRLRLFIERLLPDHPNARLMLMGGGRPLATRLLRKSAPTIHVISIRHWRDALSVPEGALLVGLGNTRGRAHRMIEWMEKGGGFA